MKIEVMHGRTWKVRKRRELRALEAAFRRYQLGAFYTPAKNGELGQINNALASLKIALSVKNWGR